MRPGAELFIGTRVPCPRVDIGMTFYEATKKEHCDKIVLMRNRVW